MLACCTGDPHPVTLFKLMCAVTRCAEGYLACCLAPKVSGGLEEVCMSNSILDIGNLRMLDPSRDHIIDSSNIVVIIGHALKETR